MSISPALTDPRPPFQPTAAGAELRQRLRTATAPIHARLDARFTKLELARLPDYRRFLEASAAALLPLEEALSAAGVAQIFPDWPARSRRQAILNDLKQINGAAAPLRFAERLDFGAVLGAMYVLEGSRLGAQVLLRTVEHSADRRVACTTAYLGHGAGQKMWKSFLVMLEEQAALLDSDASAIDGARSAFSLFEQAAARS